ncbi:MAG TPA: glycosyltransferase [Acidobacteriaceae bacterium]|jgi:spore maturation protein CgeB|nr:glycosyltransferase [Acidobacteriaceae bacterium]
MAAPLKILYVAPLDERSTALYRMWALERAGQQVVPLDTQGLLGAERLWKLYFWLGTKFGLGPIVARLNRDVLRLAREHRPDVMWGDKLLFLRPATLDALRAMGIVTVNYSIDNPFGPRRDRGWDLYLKCIPHYDLHVVQRDRNVIDYKAGGARDVLKIQTAYEPTLQFPPPAGWSDKDRDREVSFIGTPYDERPEFLLRLKREFGCPVTVSGARWMWERRMQTAEMQEIFKGDEIYLKEYREAIWRSKINLSFITHSNHDEFAHKSFEIAGCGAFLLAERSEGHLQRFVEGEEAVFFSSVEECAAQIRRYLPDEAARARIAAAGHRRAVASGYSNDGQVAKILQRVRNITAALSK